LLRFDICTVTRGSDPMKITSLFSNALIVGTAIALAGCAAQTPEMRVTRFHLGQPIAPAQISVEPRDPTLARDLEFQAYARAVQGELSRKGFTVAPNPLKSELVAVTQVNRSWQPVGPAHSPLTIGLGGGSFGGGVGVGGGVSFPVGKPRQRMDVITLLSVQLKRRSEGTVIWEGRAQAVARDGTPFAAPEAAVARLAEAMFRDFPGPSGQTITVK
jgi:hypothetical protein